VLGTGAVAGCGSSSSSSATGTVSVVAAENEYGNVASQIGGKYVHVSSVMSNPNTDPHTYEVSTGIAGEVSGAQLIIQNGVGYDDFMTKLENASPNSRRQVINVQHLLGLPDNTPNPHLWYSPATMPKVASAIAAKLGKLRPAHATYFTHNATKFVSSLNPWLQAIAQFKAKYANIPVATTEPVADYMLQAAGAKNLTPLSFQLDIMNGTDPSPQDVSNQSNLFTKHRVKVFVYNQQVTDSLTQSFITAAKQAKIPIIGVYETMPVPGYNYQSWMLAEVNALQKAVADDISTEKLS
jgi:zinc/manganese transport system substrate-binding protein